MYKYRDLISIILSTVIVFGFVILIWWVGRVINYRISYKGFVDETVAGEFEHLSRRCDKLEQRLSKLEEISK